MVLSAYVEDSKTTGVTPHASSIQVYIVEWFEAMLEDAWFTEIELHNSLLDSTKESHESFHVTLSAQRFHILSRRTRNLRFTPQTRKEALLSVYFRSVNGRAKLL